MESIDEHKATLEKARCNQDTSVKNEANDSTVTKMCEANVDTECWESVEDSLIVTLKAELDGEILRLRDWIVPDRRESILFALKRTVVELFELHDVDVDRILLQYRAEGQLIDLGEETMDRALFAS